MKRPLFSFRLTLILLAITVLESHNALAQTESECFWLAGRYDRNRIIVYFDAIQFTSALPTAAKKITPTATMFFDAVELSPEFITRFHKSEHFTLGDHYDLILEEDHVATVSLTTLIGCETDEGIGNDSYIGVATIWHSLILLRSL